ncbi:hypothetical protein J2S30_002835 [Herbaspirillum rubrisubalbicans]|nr:hypothetical protein [Herbaspirillum rubrisubalbicans]
MKTPNFANFHIRKWFLQIEDTLAGETGRAADGAPLRKIVIAACIHNPFAGQYVEDLSPWIEPSPLLGQEFARRIREAAQGQAIESYGKACLVGVDGEYEHGNALLTNPAANPVRDGPGRCQVLGAFHRQARRSRHHHRYSAGPQGCAVRAFALRHRQRAIQRWSQPR